MNKLLFLSLLVVTSAIAQMPTTSQMWLQAAKPSSAANDAYVDNWLSRISAAGGAAPSAGTIAALNTFCATLRSTGLDTNMVSMNPIVPDNLTAALTPLIYRTGFPVWTNGGFLGFSNSQLQINGLIGNSRNQTNAYLRTGVKPTLAWANDLSGGFTMYAYSNNTATMIDMGVSHSGAVMELYLAFSGTTYWDCWAGSGGGRISSANGVSGFNGIVSASRVSATDTKLYRYSSVVGLTNYASGSSSSGTRPSNEVWAVWRNTGGGESDKLPKQFSFIAVHDGLSATKTSNFVVAIQAMRTALGGGYR